MGDKYMAVSGLPEPCKEQARCIARLALDMMDLAKNVSVDGIPVVTFLSSKLSLSLEAINQHSFIRIRSAFSGAGNQQRKTRVQI